MQQTQKSTDSTITLSANPERAIQEMMSTIDALREVYIKETEALDAADTKGFFTLQDKKLSAARDYQSGIQQMLARKDEMRAVDPSLKIRLERKRADFAQLAEKNADALGRMNRCMERLGNTMRNAAREAAAKDRAMSYGGTGAMQVPERKSVSMGVSETA
jgi:hypothetical protein